ncbi:uncharacterized protein MEPE_06182 [Melanopsichium pennsylvanicum]|uniref:Uncharacterized protein n=2 Tax=Melanopsichium pennsylvanicum TaxID=63383 RepID=A0AAJ4XS93_9BASI|nr:uncharacterized protein MEPE_06182 [Melanopsichium pennsylvanicum]
MVSTSRLDDASVRAIPTSSRRSISSHAASASRQLSSVASASVSPPYAGLSSSPSSSSSLSNSKRTSISATGRNSSSRHTAAFSSTASIVNDDASPQLGRRSVSASSSKNNIDQESESIASSSSQTSRTKGRDQTNNSTNAASASRAANPNQTHQRHLSAESLRLDLDGLDLGGNSQAFVAPFENASSQPHVRSRSNNATQPPFADSQLPFTNTTYNGADADVDLFCASCATEGRTHEPLNGIEDSFSLHLRAQCSDYREIMPSQVILNAAVGKEQRMRNPSLETLDSPRQRGDSISHGQVLGGFASLGLEKEATAEPPASTRQQPVCAVLKASTDSSEAPITPIEWRDSFGTLAAPTYVSPPDWAHLTGRPCNPLDPLDVLSIEEMGFHSLDIGSLNDWEGCKLSAEILCPINGHQRIEWSVAQTTRRNKKWVVVPNATITRGTAESLSAAAQAERTVVVTNRSLWLDESESGVPSLGQRDQAQSQSSHRQLLPNRSFQPFSGKAGFELRVLRPTVGKICSPIYLANASTHRYLHEYRTKTSPRSAHIDAATTTAIAVTADRESSKGSQPIYPVLRRTRSRPYLRSPQVPLRRSRSKPYLRYSAQQQAAQASSPSINPEEFAPSLPGDPLGRMHPGESWPSARSRPSDSLSSFDSDSSIDVGSDTSSDDAGLSAINTRESMVGSMKSASCDQPLQNGNLFRESERARPAAIPMGAGARNPGRVLRSVSPDSSASQGLSAKSEASAALAGWQRSSLQHADPSSASYEVDSWQGTSPTTASASSMSAISKQSRSRKGLQKALQKKDKMLNSWFKRRPDSTMNATPGSAGMEKAKETAQQISVALNGQVSASSSTRSSLARDSQDAAAINAIAGSTPLTETALESFQRAMFRPASPESTIMGSRRGSEALTQKTIEPFSTAPEKSAGIISAPGQAGIDNRTAVNSTLSHLYGWHPEQTASKVMRSRVNDTKPTSFVLDLDEKNALLGLDAVPTGALTMLIPLPLIGRARVQDAVRYMRVNFVPFGQFGNSFEAAPGATPSALLNSGSPGNESDGGLSHSVSSGSGLASNREAAVKTPEASNWKRKLGLSSNRSGNSTTVSAGQASSQIDVPSSPAKPQAFRITAVVHDAPWTLASVTSSANLDPRLPEPGTFPVVLGYCNGNKSLEMVSEGWSALKLACAPVPTKPDGSPLDGAHPLHGVTDLIIAACSAVMDV